MAAAENLLFRGLQSVHVWAVTVDVKAARAARLLCQRHPRMVLKIGEVGDKYLGVYKKGRKRAETTAPGATSETPDGVNWNRSVSAFQTNNKKELSMREKYAVEGLGGEVQRYIIMRPSHLFSSFGQASSTRQRDAEICAGTCQGLHRINLAGP